MLYEALYAVPASYTWSTSGSVVDSLVRTVAVAILRSLFKPLGPYVRSSVHSFVLLDTLNGKNLKIDI